MAHNNETVQEGRSSIYDSDWALDAVDAGTTALTLFALICSLTPSIPEFWRGTAAIVSGLFGSGVIDRGYVRMKETLKDNRRKMLEGLARIARKEKGQLIIFGGHGSSGVDELVKTDPRHTIPILSDNDVAVTRIVDNFSRPKMKLFRRLFPFYVNLELDKEAGTSVIDSPNLDLIRFKRRNLTTTKDGAEKLIVVSLGESFVELDRKSRTNGVSLEESLVLYRRLVHKLLNSKVIENPNQGIMIRVAPLYKSIEWDRMHRRLSEDELMMRAVRQDLYLENHTLHVDLTALVLSELMTVIDPGTGIILETNDSRFDELPYLECMGFVVIKNGPRDNPIGESLRHERSGHRVVNLVMKDSDTATLAALQASQTSDVISDVLVAGRNKKRVYIFQTSEAAQLAKDMGAIHAWSVGDLVKTVVDRIIGKIKDGEELKSIQTEMDLWLKTKSIVAVVSKMHDKALIAELNKANATEKENKIQRERQRKIHQRKKYQGV